MLRLGTVTYNIARDWTLEEILTRLPALGFEGVELRATHAHGVEVGLSAAEREEVRRRFADAPLELVGLGSAFEFHSADPAEVRRNVEGTKDYIRLAHDVGAPGVKVRPNGLPAGADKGSTYRQIGDCLVEVGEYGEGFGVEVRVEVHGNPTSRFPDFAEIMGYADQPNVKACWNSNDSDVSEGGTIEPAFRSVAGRIGMVHLRDLYVDYPYRELFQRLTSTGYDGYTLAEIPDSPEPERVLRYFRALWLAMQPS